MKYLGMERIQIAVADLQISAAFYGALMIDLFDGKLTGTQENTRIWRAGSLSLVIVPCDEEQIECRRQGLPGVSHLTFRAQARYIVDRTYAFAQRFGTTIVHPPQEQPYQPGSYAVTCTDPDGLLLEVVFRGRHGQFGETSTMPVPTRGGPRTRTK